VNLSKQIRETVAVLRERCAVKKREVICTGQPRKALRRRNGRLDFCPIPQCLSAPANTEACNTHHVFFSIASGILPDCMCRGRPAEARFFRRIDTEPAGEHAQPRRCRRAERCRANRAPRSNPPVKATFVTASGPLQYEYELQSDGRDVGATFANDHELPQPDILITDLLPANWVLEALP
jgi:hypothetical protein